MDHLYVPAHQQSSAHNAADLYSVRTWAIPVVTAEEDLHALASLAAAVIPALAFSRDHIEDAHSCSSPAFAAVVEEYDGFAVLGIDRLPS